MVQSIYSSDDNFSESSSLVNPIAYEESQSISNSIPNEPPPGPPGPANIYDEADKSPNAQHNIKENTLWNNIIELTRPGFLLDHLDYQSFKVAFRTWAQIWVTVLFMVIPKISLWIGSASYLMQIVGFFNVSGGTLVAFNVLMSVICLFYALVSWINVVICLAITNRLRGSLSEQDLIKQLIEDGSCTQENILTCMISEIYSGRFLETRCSVIYIFGIIIGLTLYGMSMRIHPLLRTGFVTGLITLLILSNFYVFFPVFLPKLIALQIIKPIGITLVVKIAASMFIFPTSSSFLYFNGSLKILRSLHQTSKKNTSLMKTLKPSAPNFLTFKKYSADITSLRNLISKLEILASTIRLEISYGRFDAGDVGEFRYLIKNVINLSAGYEYYYQLLNERLDVVTDNIRGFGRRTSTSSVYNPKNTTGHSKLFTALQQSYKAVGEYENSRRMNLLKNRIYSVDPEDNLVLKDLDDVADFIKAHFMSLFDAIDFSFDAVTNWLEAANNFRIYSLIVPGSFKKHKQKQENCHQKIVEAKILLTNELEKLKNHRQMEEIMRDVTRNEEALLCLISQTSLFLNLSKDQMKSLIRMIDLFLSIDESRPTPRLITQFTRTQRDKPKNIDSTAGDNLDENQSSFWKSDVSGRDADALPPTHLYHFLGKKIVSLYNILLNKHLWFWIRASGLVVVCCIPFYCRTTASWYYANRLVWVPVVCALTVNENVGESIYGILMRFIYGFAGAVVGMVAWYVSTGNGTGNYYGYSVVTCFLYLYLSYFRHFSVHLNLVPPVLFNVTIVLIMGTSWIEGNFPNLQVNIGYGFTAAWRRHVAVTVGIAIGFFASLPRFSTSKVIIRKILAQALTQTGNLHCDVSKFALARIENPSIHNLPRHDVILEKFRVVLLKLASITTLMGPIKYEIPISGIWPMSKYARLQTLITDIVQLYLVLQSTFNQLEDPEIWVPIIMGRMGWSDAMMNANVFSIIHMGSGSLKSKIPLPKITQANLSLRHLDILRVKWGTERISLNERFYHKELVESEKDYDVNEGESLHESMVRNLDYEKLFSTDGQYNIVALLLAHMIYTRFDEVMIIIKSLVGEKYDFDYTIFEDDYEMQYTDLA